jgi:hypothetical protein
VIAILVTVAGSIRMTDKPILMASPALARLLGVHDSHVRRLARTGVLPRAGASERAKFDIRVAVPAFVRYVRSGENASSDLAEAKLRLTEAQRRDLELRTRQRQRQTVDLDEVASAFDAAMVEIGSQLDGLGGRLAGDLAAVNDPAVIRRRLFDETRRIRNTAADRLEALASADAGREPPAGTDAEDA